MITPVKILQQHHDRLFGRHRFDRLCHLPQHSFARGPLGPARQGLEGGRVEETGHLNQPARRVLTEDLSQPGPPGGAAELVEGSEQRQVRLARPVVLDALPFADPALARLANLLEEGGHQRRLPDTGLSRHEGDLAISLRAIARGTREAHASPLPARRGRTWTAESERPRLSPPRASVPRRCPTAEMEVASGSTGWLGGNGSPAGAPSR